MIFQCILLTEGQGRGWQGTSQELLSQEPGEGGPCVGVHSTDLPLLLLLTTRSRGWWQGAQPT